MKPSFTSDELARHVSAEDQKLIRQLLDYLEEKMKIALLLPPLRIPQASDFTPELLSRADANLIQGDQLFGSLKKLPGERFAVALDLLLIAVATRAHKGAAKQNEIKKQG